MKAKTRIGLGLVVAMTLVGGLLLLDGRFIKNRLIAYASGDNLDVKIARVVWSGLGFDASDVVATYGHEGDQRFVRVNIGRLAIRPKWYTFFFGQVRFDRILLGEPQVTYIDQEGGRKSTENSGAFESPLVEVDDFRISHGTFTFVRLSKGTRAVIGVREIGGKVEAFGNSTDRRDHPIKGNLRAQLGFSGDTRVTFSARPTAKETFADVDVRIENQNLKDLGDFFEPNVGLRMAGVMKLGHARSKMRGSRLTTSLRGVFEGLDLDVKKTSERSTWAAIATNLGIAVGIKRGNTDATEAEQTRTVETTRTANDSLMSFYLQGLKDAAMSVAKKPSARSLTE